MGKKQDDAWKMDLAPLLNPRSVAFVGISGGPKIGMAGGCVKNLQKFGYEGQIFPVNPKYDEILGLRSYKSIMDIPDEVDLLVLAIPADSVIPVMREASEKGVKSAIIYSAGFAEIGEKGEKLQIQLKNICEESHIRLCGPNNMGILSFRERVFVYSAHIPDDIKTGGFGFIGQSGGVTMCALASAYARGMGCSYLISSGNEAVIETSDYIRFLLDDPNTRVIGCFIEGFKDPDKFKAVADLALEKGKPIVLVKVGRSIKGQRAALSHTGSITGSDAVQEAFFKKKGITRVDTIEELAETAELFLKAKLPKRNRVLFVMISGGGCGIVSDLSQEHGLELPDISEPIRQELAPIFPAFGQISNPLDLTGYAFRNLDAYYHYLEILLKENVDIICVDPDIPWVEPLIQKTQQIAPQTDKLLTLICLTAENMDDSKRKMWRDSIIPIHQDPRRGLKAIKSLINYSEFIERRKKENQIIAGPNPDPLSTRDILKNGKRTLTEYQSKKLLNLYGIPITREELARTPDEALSLAHKVGYPVALKVQSEDIVHKTDAKVIRLNVNGDNQLLAAYEEVLSNAKRYNSKAAVEGILVQEMVAEGTETIVGMIMDKQFGPCIIFGLGGIFVEVLEDVSRMIAPLGKEETLEMIRGIKGFKLLRGFRGKPPADIEKISEVLINLSRLSLNLKDSVGEIDINPLMVYPKGEDAKVVDALITLI